MFQKCGSLFGGPYKDIYTYKGYVVVHKWHLSALDVPVYPKTIIHMSISLSLSSSTGRKGPVGATPPGRAQSQGRSAVQGGPEYQPKGHRHRLNFPMYSRA